MSRVVVLLTFLGFLVMPLVLLPTLNISVFMAADKPLDINIATTDQLKTLPRIGDAYSEKIMKGGPYQRKDELAQKKII